MFIYKLYLTFWWNFFAVSQGWKLQSITGCISSCWMAKNMGQGWTGRDTLGQRHITTQTGFDIMHSCYTCLNIYLSRNRTNGALLHFIVQIAHCLVDGSHCRTIASFPGPAQLAVHSRGESLGTRLVEQSENKMYWHHGNECMLRIIIITFENR